MGSSTGKLLGDAALTEVITFRCTKSQKALIEKARQKSGTASIGHYVKNASLSMATVEVEEEG